MRGVRRSRVAADDGGVTVEAALSIAALVIVVVLCVAAVVAVTLHVRCVDAAREAARLGARGDGDRAVATAREVAPDGARISVRVDGDSVIARVEAASPLLPMVDISAVSVAALEPEAR
ncbi:TadE family type IV pilus minor pilin [Rhodococcus sp. HNM0569]|uniref:TadE family type IV pilus minor pilin n=1 Tax=Rhodococcus sp. HNM0569 TaxID=2716340 RepID=UPI00146D68B4|nr:TadE family type IV pilus minor pilin [Rhodococcus sp. HNM0569]NLU83356.1 pilus assembly protein TadE [Rhodococcus sp. HNM0569]